MNKKEKPELVNREVSWLYFNGRVLQEAADTRNPLIERLRFLGIFSNNRDEFFRVRVATLTRLLKIQQTQEAGLADPRKVLDQIDEIVSIEEKEFMKTYHQILEEMASKNLFIINETELSAEQGVYLKKYFLETIRPCLFPIMISNLKDISTLRDRSIYLAVSLRRKSRLMKEEYALIELPTKTISRFCILPTEGDKKYVILLDDIVRYCLSDIFSVFGWDAFSAYTVKITLDAEIDIDTDVSKSFLETMTESLKQRKKGNPVRFVYDKDMPIALLKTLTKLLKIRKEDPIRGGGRYHNFKDFMHFPNLDHPELEYPPLPPLRHKDLPPHRSILAAIRKKDIMLHYPYQSFQIIIDMLREASIDPKVRSIKMTIYRAAKNSEVINALLNAARNGKKVTVFMELQARFDEEANIFWTELLQEEGVRVIQGIPGFKVHSKLILIRSKENEKNIFYANIGTGNFNEDTARVYADDSLLTSDSKITADVANAFNQMEANYRPIKYKSLVLAPFMMRNTFMKMISHEIRNAKANKPAWILIKLNNLVDETIIQKLYKASQAGVKINLIVRGICVLKPGVKGLSDNIEAISIVDRFLEHSRVMVFCNAGNPHYFITSADWMIRNFDNRIEVACPIYDTDLQKELMTMLQIQMADNVKARDLGSKKINVYAKSSKRIIHSQLEIYNYFKTSLESTETES